MEARIACIAEDYAILEFKHNQRLRISTEELPSGLKEGMKISLKLENFAQMSEASSFKDFLNDILKEDSKVS